MRFVIGDKQRLFIGLFPAGVVYADRSVEVDGDYKRLAFLPYDTLEPKFQPDCPLDLAAQIQVDVAQYQSLAGREIEVTVSGQTVRLGRKAA